MELLQANTISITCLLYTSEKEVSSKTQTANNLSYKSVITTSSEATSSTKLGDLSVWSKISTSPVLTAKNTSGGTTSITLTSTMTIGDVVTKLNSAGLSAAFSSSGVLAVTGGEVSGNAAEALGIKLSLIHIYTALSDLGVTTGEYNIWNNGVKYTALISSDETVGSLLDTLAQFGIQASIVNNGNTSTIRLTGNGNAYVAKSASINNASNVVDVLFPSANKTTTYNYNGNLQIYSTVTTHSTATEDTLLSEFDTPWGNTCLLYTSR